MNISFPGESSEYRAARNQLLEQEAELRRVLHGVPGVRVVPEPPQTPLFHVHLAADPDRVVDHAALLAEKTGIRLFRLVKRAAHPVSCSFEISVSEQLRAQNRQRIESVHCVELLQQGRSMNTIKDSS